MDTEALQKYHDLINEHEPSFSKNSDKSLKYAKKEEESWNDLERASVALANDRYKGDTVHRNFLAKWAAFVVSIWLILVVTILCLNNFAFHLPDNVLITLLTTTTINILGLMIIVLKDIFNSGN